MALLTAKEVNNLLAVFFYRQFGWSISSVLGSDPYVERVMARPLPRRLEIIIDVGFGLEKLSELERAAIYYRWNLIASRDEEDRLQEVASAESTKALRSGHKERATAMLRESEKHKRASDRYTKEIRRQEKRRDYLAAMNRLKVEIISRDAYARGIRGDAVGIGA